MHSSAADRRMVGKEETGESRRVRSQGRRAAPGVSPGEASSSSPDTLSSGGGTRREAADRTVRLLHSDVALTSGEDK